MEGTIMQCPKCQIENREGVKFCEECGAKFELECPACKANIPLGRKFCGECGYNLKSDKETLTEISETETFPFQATVERQSSDVVPITEARKHVTVLFSDLTGYT
jgi:predicted amidophosphoribosyltransferase